MNTYVAIDDYIGPFKAERTERPWNAAWEIARWRELTDAGLR